MISRRCSQIWINFQNIRSMYFKIDGMNYYRGILCLSSTVTSSCGNIEYERDYRTVKKLTLPSNSIKIEPTYLMCKLFSKLLETNLL